MAKARKKKEKKPCDIEGCPKKGTIHIPDEAKAGNHVGSGPKLADNIIKAKYPMIGVARNHPLSDPNGATAQAHHLICAEAMKKDKAWKRICSIFGYDINCVENGVFLPASMRIACQLKIPLHRGNHSATVTIMAMNYVSAVIETIKGVKNDALNGKYCEKRDQLISELNEISSDIWFDVESFNWTLTFDGHDYESGKGCCGAKSLASKRILMLIKEKCPKDRKHGLDIIGGTYFLEQS